MRALGPGSVSSLLKVGLDLVYFVLWIGLAGLVIGVFGTLVLAPLVPINNIDLSINGRSDPETIRRFVRGPAIPIVLCALALYLAGLVVIVGRLRHVFETLTRGDPFQPLNVSRLRVVGVVLIALEFWNHSVPPILRRLIPGDAETSNDRGLSLTGWFAILVVFVLAEVFREGARLRREAELTI
jgi:hypothetical protein